MKPAIALSLLLVISPVGACTQLNPNAPISSTAPQTMLAAKKSLIAAHALHEAAADALTAAANANLCIRQCAVDAKRYLDQSEVGLKVADGLVAAGDAQSIEAKIAGAIGLISQAQQLLGGH